jgi:hypothetical protein
VLVSGRLLKFLKDARLVLRRDTPTGIADHDVHFAADTSRDHVNASAILREFHRVRQQVEDHLLDLALVRLDEADGRIDLQAELQAVSTGALAHHGKSVVQGLGQRKDAELEVHPTGLDF